MRVGAVCSSSDIDVHYAILASIEVVGNAESRRDFNRPIARLEGGVAMEEFKAELESFAGSELFRLSKKLSAARLNTAYAGRRRRTSLFDSGRADSRQNHKEIVASDWIVAL